MRSWQRLEPKEQSMQQFYSISPPRLIVS
jgi:hypothetical protein